ncbi:MAG: SPOR domain-containing protein [Deltaproteobacteria bacterium]|nr:SPOR domain-containing protein [Deltaproteobacteria bacterium]
MKGKKNLFLSAAIAVVVIIILLIVLFPKGKNDEDGAEVISKRVKLNLIDETVKVEEDGLKPVEGAEPSAQAAPVSAVDKAPVAEVKKALEPAPRPAPTVKKTPSRPKTVKTIKTASVDKRALAAKKPWAINVASFPDREGANSLARSLKSAGYNAYITSFKKDGVNYRRVRVGFYASREDAQRAGSAIKRQHNVQSPWIVKPGKDETAQYIR